MGSCCSPGFSQTAQSRAIDEHLKEWRLVLNDEIRVLLLGTGESGKSTVFKQMKILSAKGFTPEEVQQYKRLVLSNCINQMKTILNAATRLNIDFQNPRNRMNAQQLMMLEGVNAWNSNVGAMIKMLWADQGVRAAYGHRDRVFHLDDSASYLFENVDRFSHPDYTPTEQDILRTRCRTTGIDEAIFVFEDLEFRLIDVGGQRSERRKWIHNFDCVTAVLFCVALSDYDQVLREDATQNRMKEALLLFDEICNSPWFRSVDFIVFFNKTDIFREKFPRSPLTTCFPHYSEGPNPDTAKLFISKQFLELNHAPHRIYPHFTCAIDPGNMKIVFSAVRKTLLSLRLGEAGIGSV